MKEIYLDDCKTIEQVVDKLNKIQSDLYKKQEDYRNSLKKELDNFVGTHEQFLEKNLEFIDKFQIYEHKNHYSSYELWGNAKRWIKNHVDCHENFSNAKLDIMYEFAEMQKDNYYEIFDYMNELVSMVDDVINCHK